MGKIQREGFGTVNDNDQSLKSKTGGAFGLNSGVFFTKIIYNATAGADGAAADAVDINVKIGDREYNRRIYDVTGDLFGSNGDKIPAPVAGAEWEDEYTIAYNAKIKQQKAVVIHAVKSVGVTQASLDAALATPAANFAAWAQIVCGLLPQTYTTIPIDTFLQYQWQIADGQDRTFLELAKNMKGGRFFCPSVKGDFKESFEGSLKYVTPEGVEHPFTRDSNFMGSEKAYVQEEGQENGPRQAVGSNENFTADAGKAASKSKW
jgi:hypothetical protein